jgi:hypothetical protein
LAFYPGIEKLSQQLQHCSAYPHTCAPASGKVEWTGQLIKHLHQKPTPQFLKHSPATLHPQPHFSSSPEQNSIFQCTIWVEFLRQGPAM